MPANRCGRPNAAASYRFLDCRLLRVSLGFRVGSNGGGAPISEPCGDGSLMNLNYRTKDATRPPHRSINKKSSSAEFRVPRRGAERPRSSRRLVIGSRIASLEVPARKAEQRHPMRADAHAGWPGPMF